jgi:hypothetical protein
MQRDSKLGYGFLLVGAGLPFLIDKALGLTAAIIVSVVCVVSGGSFLVAGHRHSEGETRPRRKIWELIIIAASLGTLTVLLSIGILKVISKKESHKSDESQPQSQQGVRREEPKTESPNVENPPTVKKKFPPKPIEKSEPPAFSVANEFSILSPGSSNFGTRFWLRTPTPNGCVISQAQAALYIRIDNLRPYPVTIVSYNVEAIKPLIRISSLNRSIFAINPPGQSFYGATRAGETVPATQGSGLFAMATTPSENLNFSNALLLELDTLDGQIAKPLSSGMPIRGWAFFEYPYDKNDYIFVVAMKLFINIKTDRGESFSFPLPMENGDPNGDVLPRDFKTKDVVDLSVCQRQRYEIPR